MTDLPETGDTVMEEGGMEDTVMKEAGAEEAGVGGGDALTEGIGGQEVDAEEIGMEDSPGEEALEVPRRQPVQLPGDIWHLVMKQELVGRWRFRDFTPRVCNDFATLKTLRMVNRWLYHAATEYLFERVAIWGPAEKETRKLIHLANSSFIMKHVRHVRINMRSIIPERLFRTPYPEWTFATFWPFKEAFERFLRYIPDDKPLPVLDLCEQYTTKSKEHAMKALPRQDINRYLYQHYYMNMLLPCINACPKLRFGTLYVDVTDEQCRRYFMTSEPPISRVESIVVRNCIADKYQSMLDCCQTTQDNNLFWMMDGIRGYSNPKSFYMRGHIDSIIGPMMIVDPKADFGKALTRLYLSDFKLGTKNLIKMLSRCSCIEFCSFRFIGLHYAEGHWKDVFKLMTGMKTLAAVELEELRKMQHVRLYRRTLYPMSVQPKLESPFRPLESPYHEDYTALWYLMASLISKPSWHTLPASRIERMLAYTTKRSRDWTLFTSY